MSKHHIFHSWNSQDIRQSIHKTKSNRHVEFAAESAGSTRAQISILFPVLDALIGRAWQFSLGKGWAGSLRNIWMQGTTRPTNKLFWILFVAGSLVVEMHVPDVTLCVNKPNWLQGWHYGKIQRALFGPNSSGPELHHHHITTIILFTFLFTFLDLKSPC